LPGLRFALLNSYDSSSLRKREQRNYEKPYLTRLVNAKCLKRRNRDLAPLKKNKIFFRRIGPEESPGKLLIAFAPADKMEEYFRQILQNRGATYSNQNNAQPARFMHSYGVELIGPPLALG
jgi:hypothetical protein